MISQLGKNIYVTVINYWSWWWKVDNEKDKLARTILTISVVTLVAFWHRLTLSYSTKGAPPLPPGPWGLPIIGYLPFLGSNLHQRFVDMAHIYGPIFSLRLGSKLHVVVNSLDLAKSVVRDHDRTFANRDPPRTALILTGGANDIAWSNSDAHWRTMRRLLVSRVLSHANLEACRGFRQDEVKKTVKDVYTRRGTKTDVNEIAFDTELNVVTSMLWGKSTPMGDEFRDVEFKIVALVGASNVSDFLPMLSRFDLQGREREMTRQTTYLYGIFDRVIEERIEANSKCIKGGVEKDKRKDFLQILLELKEEKDTPTSFNDTQVKALLMDIVTAATDTTSTVTEWVMAELLHNPDVMKKVQNELTDVVGLNNVVEESHLPKLRYLDAVVKETFRLHPPLPLLFQRCPNQSCIVGGYTVPKGTIVYVNVWAIHRDPKNWSNPSEFDPDRFLTNVWDYNGNNLKFFPFGSGRRICPGVLLGEKMSMYILASLLHSFEWNLPKDEEFELSDEFGIVTKKRRPLIAIPTQRLSDARLYDNKYTK